MSSVPAPDEFAPRWISTELRYDAPGVCIIRFTDLYQSSGGLYAYIEVWWVDRSPEVLLYAGRLDLKGSRTLSTITKEVSKRAENKAIPVQGWEDAFFEIIPDAIRIHREGEPVIHLNGTRPVSQKFILDPLVGATGATALIAQGGSYKSTVALAAALAVADDSALYLGMKPKVAGPVLYLDWEADAATHAERAHALARDGVPETLMYQPQRGRPLARTVEQTKRKVDEEGVVMCVIDSVMLARGGDAFGAESTSDFFAAVAELDVPCLLVDHKSKDQIKNGSRGSYGSIVNENTIRLAWELGYPHFMPDDTARILIRPGKRNNFGRLPNLAFSIKVTTDEEHVWREARINRLTPEKVTVLRPPDGETPLKDRIIEVFKDKGGAPMRVQEIAEAIDERPEAVRQSLNRHEDEFHNVALTGAGRWVLRHEMSHYGTPALPDPY